MRSGAIVDSAPGGLKQEPSKRHVGSRARPRVRLFPTQPAFSSEKRHLRAISLAARELKFARGAPIKRLFTRGLMALNRSARGSSQSTQESGASWKQQEPTSQSATRKVFLPRPARRGDSGPRRAFFSVSPFSICHPERNAKDLELRRPRFLASLGMTGIAE